MITNTFRLFLALVFSFATITASQANNAVGATVKLKITYNGQGVADTDITVKHGKAAIGSGRTDGGGNVTINCSNLISKSIDLRGEKRGPNAFSYHSK